MNWDEYFMRMVYLVASKSCDLRTKVGSVIVRDNQILTTGYNGFPRGVEYKEHRIHRPAWILLK